MTMIGGVVGTVVALVFAVLLLASRRNSQSEGAPGSLERSSSVENSGFHTEGGFVERPTVSMHPCDANPKVQSTRKNQYHSPMSSATNIGKEAASTREDAVGPDPRAEVITTTAGPLYANVDATGSVNSETVTYAAIETPATGSLQSNDEGSIIYSSIGSDNSETGVKTQEPQVEESLYSIPKMARVKESAAPSEELYAAIDFSGHTTSSTVFGEDNGHVIYTTVKVPLAESQL